MQISKNKHVTIDYTLKDDAGTVLDSSQNREPLSYVQGVGQLIPGLEAQLEGKSKGDQIQVQISPEEGYGKRIDELEQDIPREQFQGVDDLQVGMQFQVRDQSGGAHVVTVTDVKDDLVRIDGNHPLAGMNLNFDVTVVNVREATEEELGDCGHDHDGCEGCDGCH